MDKPIPAFRSEMRKHTTETIMQLGRLIFANLAAYRRMKAKGYTDQHRVMQFLQRERIAYLKQIDTLRGEPW